MPLARIRARARRVSVEPDDLGEPPHVDVAPAQHHRDLVAGRSDLAREQRRDADRAAALDDLLLLPVAVRHRRGDLVLAHQHDLVDQITHQREGVAVVEADAAAQGIGEARLLHDLDRPPGAQALVHRGAPLHGDADHPDRGIGALQRERDAADQAAAGQRHQHGVEIGQVLEQLEADRPLPGDDLEVLERRDEDPALLLGQSPRVRLGRVLALARDPHLGARAPAPPRPCSPAPAST